MKKTTVGLMTAVAALAIAGSASAQTGPTTPFSVEVRGGVSLPGGDAGDVLETGFTVGGDVIFQATPMIGIYAGYNFNSYGIDSDDPDVENVDAEIKGFDAGVRVGFAGGSLPFTPFLKGGVLYQKAALTDGDASIEGDYETGFQIGGGIELPLGNRISFTPQASYNSVEDAEYINIEAGLRIRL